MARFSYIFLTGIFGVGAASGVLLLVLCSIDREWRDLPRVAFGTVALSGAAWSARRGWQRENQAREARRESAAAESRRE